MGTILYLPGGNAMRWESADRAERPGFTEHDFKICELCGALNLAASRECMICGWHGRFDYDPEAVKVAIQEFEHASGRLDDAFFSQDVLLEEYLGAEGRRPNRVITWLKRVFGFDGSIDDELRRPMES